MLRVFKTLGFDRLHMDGNSIARMKYPQQSLPQHRSNPKCLRTKIGRGAPNLELFKDAFDTLWPWPLSATCMPTVSCISLCRRTNPSRFCSGICSFSDVKIYKDK